MYDRVGLYRGKKSLCCVNNSKRHLTKRFMGYAERHRTVWRSGVCKQCDSDPDGAADDGQSPEESGKCQKQKRAGGGWLRQRQDEILVETQPFTMPQFLRGHWPERLHYKRIEKRSVSQTKISWRREVKTAAKKDGQRAKQRESQKWSSEHYFGAV